MEPKEHLCKNSACSQHGVIWQTDAIGLQNCYLGLSSHLISWGAVATVTGQELSDRTSYFLALSGCIIKDHED
jgi:hypothetical protein